MMTDAKSSAAMAAVASDIMAMAHNGGPVRHFEQQLRQEFALTGGGDDAVLAKIEKVFRPYFDNAESLAASVLRQRQQ